MYIPFITRLVKWMAGQAYLESCVMEHRYNQKRARRIKEMGK